MSRDHEPDDVELADGFRRCLEAVAKHVDDDTAPIAGHMVIAAALLELANAVRCLPAELDLALVDAVRGLPAAYVKAELDLERRLAEYDAPEDESVREVREAREAAGSLGDIEL